MRLTFGALLRAIAFGAALLFPAALASAQEPGEEAEDELYLPGEGAEVEEDESDPEEGVEEDVPTGPLATWADSVLGGEFWLRAGGVLPFGTPSRFGDGPAFAPHAAIGWRGFFGDAEEPQLFVELSLEFLTAAFENDRADLADLEPSASSLIGRLETQADYFLMAVHVGAELWRFDRFRLIGWLGAGIGLERRQEDFSAAPTFWDDVGHRSVALGEAGVAVGWLIGSFTFELRVAGIAMLGDEPPVGGGLVAGLGLGIRL